jgi:DNA ligase-1
MFHPTTVRHAAHLVLAMGACWQLPVLAVNTDSPTIQAQAVVPPDLMLGKNWQASLDPSAYLVSEKLDGVRAFWDGQVLRFRSGRLIAAPKWFLDALPTTPLDGELWMGRQSFDRVSAAVRRRTPIDAEWQALKYMVFDLPRTSGTFAERSVQIVSVVGAAGVPWMQPLPQLRGTDADTLQRQLMTLVADGAEGLMLHHANALWTPGRSDTLRKLKSVPDEEARVVAHLPGKGRHLGRMGALLLEMPSGQRFALGTGFTDAQRASPPALGATVTYAYRDRTPAGLPKFASFLRVMPAE